MFILTSITLVSISSFAQDNYYVESKINIRIPEVALLDLESENSSSILLTPSSPTEAGEALNFINISDASVWINYSSILGSGLSSGREVSAVIEGNIPNGVLLKLNVSADNGYGAGKIGIPTNAIILSSQPQSIIKNIGSCYKQNLLACPALHHKNWFSYQ